MREPVYEYDFPEPYLAKQKYFPLKRQFNTEQATVCESLPKVTTSKETLVRLLPLAHQTGRPHSL
ncbi:hypothetical protein E2C01_031272 [Portunus trituberculatus]|uniref:Uncharacterized protein n=1 Tax=Portunus trituberculatus TaxID=210409 RepID=A0A5B7EU28_PORTR|nr:hypothetical protein [Portunus trituberculatus]